MAVKRKDGGIRRVGDRIFCARCGVEMKAAKHAKLKGMHICPKCNAEAVVLGPYWRGKENPDGV